MLDDISLEFATFVLSFYAIEIEYFKGNYIFNRYDNTSW